MVCLGGFCFAPLLKSTVLYLPSSGYRVGEKSKVLYLPSSGYRVGEDGIGNYELENNIYLVDG